MSTVKSVRKWECKYPELNLCIQYSWRMPDMALYYKKNTYTLFPQISTLPTARLSEKNTGASWPPSFHFCRQNKYSGRQKLYLRINGFSFVKDNGLSLVYFFPKKKVTYLRRQVGDQAWKFGRHWVKAGCIGDPVGRNVEPCQSPG